MTDIIATIAWRDDEDQWHKANYWCYTERRKPTYSIDLYSDGDHEDCLAREVPSAAEIENSWLDYSRFVLETGTDPLWEFLVRRHITRQERWEFKFARTVLGPLLLEARHARHARRLYERRALPAHVREYLGLGRGGILNGFKTWAEFEQCVEGVKPRRWFSDLITHKVERNPATITRELRAIARRHLRRSI